MTAYFLSDLHLGAPYFHDSREAEMRAVAFLDSVKDKADAIFLLGDVLDYWYEYRYVVPRGFVRFFGKIAELADKGIRIVWLIGNHDIWIFDYLPSELGIEVYDGHIVECIDGHNFFMTHGDGIGRLKPQFRFLRGLFRSKVCQKMFSGIHPRWTVPFAYAWSRKSRLTGPQPSKEYAERLTENILTFSKEYLSQHPDIDYFLYGHLHLLERFKVGKNAEAIVLGEWISMFSYAEWDGEKLILKRYEGQKA